MRARVSNLRGKLGPHCRLIQTVRGRGFQIVGFADERGDAADPIQKRG